MIRSTVTVAASNYLEAGAIVAGAGGLSLWVKYLGLTSIWTGLLGAVSANGFGAALGALISGYLIDMFGRKFIYKYDLLVYMLGMLFIIFANSFALLLAGYIIVGIAVGALIPAAWTYIAEEAPSHKRAANVGWTQFAWSLGPVITLLLSYLLAPLGLLGSRIIFGQLFVVALITWVMQQKLRESKIWEEEKQLSIKKKVSGIATIPLWEMLTTKSNIKPLILLIGIYFFWNLVAGTMGFFMPFIYQSVGGISEANANLFQGILWLLTVTSTYAVFIKYGDKVNRKRLFCIGSMLNIIAWLILSLMNMHISAILLFVILWGIAAGFGAQAFYALFAGELFHTRYRAQAQGFMFCIARLGVGLISLVVPLMMEKVGFKISGLIMVIFLIISTLVGLFLIPDTQGKTLRAIEKERYG